MPSYSHYAPQAYQLPLTPPEDLYTGYTKDAATAMPYPLGTYSLQTGVRRQDDHGYDYTERYGHHTQSHPSAPQPMMYQHNSYPNLNGNMSATLPPTNNFYKPAVGPILPPMRGYEAHHAPAHDPQPQLVHDSRVHYERQPQEVKEEKPVGGVSAKLDYDMDIMTDFVSETAHQIILPNKAIPPTFRKWVFQVLSATRLPSATILLSFDYLSTRMRMLQTSRRATVFGEPELYRILTVSLILGSKFLDDNTFINRSWAEVSGIVVGTLNVMEQEWLRDIHFNLHRDPTEPHGFQSFLARWKHFEAEKKAARDANRRPSPINTTVQHHRPSHAMYAPPPQSAYPRPSPPPAYSVKQPQSSYPTPSYNRYDPFVVCRSSSDTSPASAPHTGPTTPEYYGPPGTWGSINGSFGFSRLHGSASSFAPRPQQAQHAPLPQPQAPQPPFLSLGYPPAPVYAADHGPNCMCILCNRRYMMVPDYGMPQPVMA